MTDSKKIYYKEPGEEHDGFTVLSNVPVEGTGLEQLHPREVILTKTDGGREHRRMLLVLPGEPGRAWSMDYFHPERPGAAGVVGNRTWLMERFARKRTRQKMVESYAGQ